MSYYTQQYNSECYIYIFMKLCASGGMIRVHCLYAKTYYMPRRLCSRFILGALNIWYKMRNIHYIAPVGTTTLN